MISILATRHFCLFLIIYIYQLFPVSSIAYQSASYSSIASFTFTSPSYRTQPPNRHRARRSFLLTRLPTGHLAAWMIKCSPLHWYTLIVILILSIATTPTYGLMSKSRKRELRELTRDTFHHAYRNYKRVAFPADELLPLSCKPQGHDRVQSEVSCSSSTRPHRRGPLDATSDNLLSTLEMLGLGYINDLSG